jgi:predicted nucleic acid-binding protein
MSFILDTSVLIDIANSRKDTLSKLKEIISSDSSLPSITFLNDFEFRYGIKDKSEANQLRLLEFLNKFIMVNTTKATPMILSEIKHKYDKEGKMLSLTDLLIASLAIENNSILITKDNDFRNISELRCIVI